MMIRFLFILISLLYIENHGVMSKFEKSWRIWRVVRIYILIQVENHDRRKSWSLYFNLCQRATCWSWTNVGILNFNPTSSHRKRKKSYKNKKKKKKWFWLIYLWVIGSMHDNNVLDDFFPPYYLVSLTHTCAYFHKYKKIWMLLS